MHNLFSDWYSMVDPQASRETLTKRWTATEELSKSITMPQIAELAAYVTRSRQSAPDWLQGKHKEHDALMRTRSIDEELRVLAAAVLRVIVDGAETDGPVVAAGLALLTGAFGLQSEPRWLKEHLDAAASKLAETGRSVREPVGEASIAVASPDEINGALSSIESAIKSVAEANDYLWWAFLRNSRLLGGPYTSHAAPVIAVVAPADVFGLVRSVPVASETEALLLHVVLEAPGARDADLSFKHYISALGRENAKRIGSDLPADCRTLCPVMWAISAASKNQGWQTEFEKLFGFKTTSRFSTAAVAIQGLRERSLVSVFSAASES